MRELGAGRGELESEPHTGSLPTTGGHPDVPVPVADLGIEGRPPSLPCPHLGAKELSIGGERQEQTGGKMWREEKPETMGV